MIKHFLLYAILLWFSSACLLSTFKLQRYLIREIIYNKFQSINYDFQTIYYPEITVIIAKCNALPFRDLANFK